MRLVQINAQVRTTLAKARALSIAMSFGEGLFVADLHHARWRARLDAEQVRLSGAKHSMDALRQAGHKALVRAF